MREWRDDELWLEACCGCGGHRSWGGGRGLSRSRRRLGRGGLEESRGKPFHPGRTTRSSNSPIEETDIRNKTNEFVFTKVVVETDKWRSQVKQRGVYFSGMRPRLITSGATRAGSWSISPMRCEQGFAKPYYRMYKKKYGLLLMLKPLVAVQSPLVGLRMSCRRRVTHSRIRHPLLQ